MKARTIYDLCYEALDNVLDVIYDNCKPQKVNLALRDFLVSDSSNRLKKELESLGLENIEYAKRIMILIIASKAYLSNYYDFKHGINKEETEETLDKLNELGISGIIREFREKTEFSEALIEDYISYFDDTYIFKMLSKDLIFKDGKMPELLKINPFEILDYMDYNPNGIFLSSELAIQNIFDIYDKSLEAAYENGPSDEDEEDFDEFVVNEFWNLLREKYDNEVSLKNIISYLLGNVYEAISEFNSAILKQKHQDLCSRIENSTPSELIDAFLEDYEFALQVIDTFIDYNESLVYSELVERRKNIEKKPKCAKVLKRLNPYYIKEKIFFAQKNRMSKY